MGRRKQSADGFNYKEWYKANKKRLSKERKEKYESDHDHRAKIQADAKAYYHATNAGVKRDRKTLTDGKTTFITIGKISEMINRKVQTIREYHNTAVIPEPSFYDSRGWRLYTFEQANLIKKIFAAFDRKEIKSLTDVSEILHAKWKKR